MGILFISLLSFYEYKGGKWPLCLPLGTLKLVLTILLDPFALKTILGQPFKAEQPTQDGSLSIPVYKSGKQKQNRPVFNGDFLTEHLSEN